MDDLEEFRSAIADPTRGPLVAGMVRTELDRVVVAISADDVSSVPFSEPELMRRAEALYAATERLASMSALAGYWAPDSTARLWPHALAALLGARDRGSGLSVWLDLIGYPGLLVLYAFGLGASISRRYGTLATILASPVPDEHQQRRPAIVVVNSAYLREDVAVKLSGAKSARWPLSDHLLSAARPWFADVVPSDALFEREFDRFELLASLVYFDLERGDGDRAWSPIGRFARFGRYDHAIFDELLAETRLAATQSGLLESLGRPDEDRAAKTLAGFREHLAKAFAQVW